MTRPFIPFFDEFSSVRDPEMDLIDGAPAPWLMICLLPDEQVQSAADHHRRLWRGLAGARWPARRHLHLTLHPLGCVHWMRVDKLRQELAEIRVDEMRLVLNSPQVWGKVSNERKEIQKLAVWRPEENDALTDLRQRLAIQLRRLGFRQPETKTPHVTLARDIRNATPPAASPAVEWTVRSFELVWSRRLPEVKHEVLGHYAANVPPLDGPARHG